MASTFNKNPEQFTTPQESPEKRLQKKISLQLAAMTALDYLHPEQSIAEENDALIRWVREGYAEIYAELVQQRPELMDAYEKKPDDVVREVVSMLQNMKSRGSDHPKTNR